MPGTPTGIEPREKPRIDQTVTRGKIAAYYSPKKQPYQRPIQAVTAWRSFQRSLIKRVLAFYGSAQCEALEHQLATAPR